MLQAQVLGDDWCFAHAAATAECAFSKEAACLPRDCRDFAAKVPVSFNSPID